MTRNPQWTIRRADWPSEKDACLSVRQAVFVDEQGVDPAIEYDGLDDECRHYAAFADGRAVATARVRALDDRYKIQRVAVLASMRGTGLGAALMRTIMDDLSADAGAGGRFLFLSSQVQAMPFYERLGFEVCSGEYPDAGIPHRDMRAAMPTS